MNPLFPPWKLLFEAALSESRPKRLLRLLREAEAAMVFANENMSAGSCLPEYEELTLAMRVLYEHGLRNGIDVRGVKVKKRSAPRTPLTTKQLKSVACPKCGAQPKEPCRLPNGRSRTSLHMDRYAVSIEHLSTRFI